MPKRRLPPKQSNKKKNKVLETADEFLEVGIEFEESGDRWRPGDKLKAGRFYLKAIESYEAALKRKLDLFDAAYNYARLQYQLAQNPKLLGSTHNESRLLLEKALKSHRHCLALNPENEDALFNTGQVLCSFAEALVEYKTAPIEAKTEAAQLLVEAVEILQKCLVIQEAQYAALQASQDPESQRLREDVRMEEEGTAAAETSNGTPTEVADGRIDEDSGSGPGQWAVIQTPITQDQLLDTALAELEACVTFCPLAAQGLSKPLVWAHDIANLLLELKITPLSQTTGRQGEASLANANFVVALAEASFKSGGTTDLTAWEASIRTAFGESTGWQVSADFQALCDKADAHIQLATTAAEQGAEIGLVLAWRQYAFAAQSLSAAAKLEPLKAEINIARGDVEILRAKIEIPAAVKSRALLLKNAEVYYRGAKKMGGDDERVKSEAVVKEAMVAFETGNSEALKGVVLSEIVRDVTIEAVDEGIFGVEWLDRVGVRASA